MTKLPYRRLTVLAIAAASILLLAVLPAAGQAEDAEAMVRLDRVISTAHALPGSTFRVTLSIDVLQDLDGVGVREKLPFGWTVHPVETEGSAFKRSGNEWVFTEQLAEGTTLELVYEITVPPADRLYAETLPTCFEIAGTFQATVPRFEVPIPGETTVEIVTALPIPTAVAHLVPGSLEEPDRIDLRLSGRISGRQLDRALEYWATDSAVPWTEGEIIDLAMMEKLTALYEACTEVGEPLPLSVDPDLIAVRTIDTFLPCDAVLLPEGCLDPRLPARQFSVTVEITGSHDAYGVGLAEWFPQGWRVTPVEHPGFAYRPSATEWVYPDRLPAGQTIAVTYLVEVVESTTDQLSTYSGCCGAPATFIGAVSSGLECSEVQVIGESEAYVWQCLPVLLAISRWDVDEDRLDATLSDSVSFPQVQRAVEFWLSNTAVPHTCGYTVGYHMLKRIIAYWLAGVPVTKPLPGEVQATCQESDDCYAPSCPGGGLCHLTELQRVEDYVGIPNVPRIAVSVEGTRELTCRVPATTLHAVVDGGTPPYRYEWLGSGGKLLGTSDSLDVSEPGTYTAVVVSVGGCRVGQQVPITQDIEAPQVSIDVGGELSCTTSEILLTASIHGGRPPFEVRWFGEGGETLGEGPRLAVASPARFTVLVEGANGCTARAEVEVLENREAPVVDAGPDRTLTCRMTEVALEGSATAGHEPYSYRWTNEDDETMSTGPSAQVGAPGTYTLTVTGANGCSASDRVCVKSDANPPVVELAASGPITCADSAVTLTATVSEARAPVLLAWLDSSERVIGESLQVVVAEAGAYTLYFEGANGCAAEKSIIVYEDFEAPTVDARDGGTLTCATPEVELRAVVAGGRSPYQFAWVDGTGRTVATTETASVDQPGTYTVTVTGANGCAAAAEVQVHEDVGPPAVTAVAADVLTCRTSTVVLSAAIEGGRPPYEVAWTAPSGSCLGTSETLAVDEPGTYIVTVTGANGCAASDTVAVSQDISAPIVEASGGGELTCDDTEMTLTAQITGGREPYLVAWTDSTGIVLATAEQLIVNRPGTYRVTVTGANGCAGSDTVTVTQDLLAPTVEACASGELTCVITEVALAARISGGREPYAIAWMDPAGAVLATTESLIVDRSGTYRVTVTGANGCAGSDTVTVTQDLLAPTVEASASGELTCASTRVSLATRISGGREPYAIAWTDPAGAVLATTENLIVDRPGTYRVTATGANGCAGSDIVTVTQDLVAPTVEASASGELTCAITEVILAARISGGREPYAIAWTDPAGAVLATTENLIVDRPGTYRVTATGANGCAASDTVTVTQDLLPPIVEASADGELTCAITEVILAARISGGREPYAIAWTDPTGAVLATTESLIVDRPGTYRATATGANGCAGSDTVTVTQDLLAPAVEASASGGLTCAVAEVTLTAAVEGGRPPYEIAWTDASGLWCGSTGTIVVTEAGMYTVIAVGHNGCSAFASVTVTEDLAPPTVDLGPDRVLTCAEPQIVLFALPFGGIGPFDYRWADHRGNTFGFGPELCVTSPGTYEVTVIGANGCSLSDFVVVHDGINAPTVDLGPDRMLGCCGGDIELIPQITGGTEPYVYEWYNECDVVIGSRPTLTVNQPGIYLLIVRTVDGCIASDSVVVQEPSP